MSRPPTPYLDMHLLDEDLRIKVIGETARQSPLGVAVILEKGQPEKIERYIRKVADNFPDVFVLGRADGPTPLVTTIKFGKRPN